MGFEFVGYLHVAISVLAFIGLTGLLIWVALRATVRQRGLATLGMVAFPLSAAIGLAVQFPSGDTGGVLLVGVGMALSTLVVVVGAVLLTRVILAADLEESGS